MDEIIQHLSRWLHILPAIILVGGTIFMNLVLTPALDGNDPEQNVKAQVKRTWSRIIMLCALLLLVSGFYNTYLTVTGDEKPGGMYHGLLTLKLVLVFGIFYISSLLAGKSEPAKKFQQKEALWSKVNMIAAITVVLLAGAMKLTPRKAKPPATNTGFQQIQTEQNLRLTTILRSRPTVHTGDSPDG